MAGLALAGRLTYPKGKRFNSESPNWTLRNRRAPMLAGSSWTHNTGVPSAYPSSAAVAPQVERVQLLQSHQRHVRALQFLPSLPQIVVQLSRTQQDPPDVRRRHHRLPAGSVGTSPWPGRPGSIRRPDAATGSSSRNTPPAASATAAAPAAASGGTSAPGSTDRRPGCSPRPPTPGTVPAARSNVPALSLEPMREHSIVSPDNRRHLSSALTMNWSMITCATFAKSPNCASGRRQPVRHVQAVPIVEPQHARLAQRTVVHMERRLLGPGSSNAVYERPVWMSCTTACR